ncbi:GNAT family N-acetyltransferase [Subtercola sp. YIM 133946]|uniref:GNAT family N-acetyltransferase n=1 Tax=Subtercola sp. YIM 133946 TaxID=3118909 RepID=UPI002F92A0C6
MSTEIENRHDQNRYVLLVDGEEAGLIDYQLRGDAIVLVHTEVDPTQRLQGLAGELVKGALDDIRTTTSLKVVAQCPFAAHWIDEHPEYQELLERG